MLRPLTAGAKGSGFKTPVSRVHVDIWLSGLYERCGRFIGIELGLGPVDLCSIPALAFRFDHQVMTMSKLCTHTCALENQAVHPLGVGKLVPAIC